MKVRYGRKWFQGSMREVARLCLHAVFGSASLLLCMVPASALAQQQNAGRGINNRPLPDAPLPMQARRFRLRKHPLRKGQPASQAPCWT